MSGRRGTVVETIVSITLEEAELIRNAFLPANERKCRSATPEVIAAVTTFKAAITRAKGGKP